MTVVLKRTVSLDLMLNIALSQLLDAAFVFCQQHSPANERFRKYFKAREYLAIPKNIIGRAVSQLQNINIVKWNKNTATKKFWAEVKDFRNASGENPFSELFECAKQAMTLPHSNADGERLFSAMNYAKNKLRDSMKTDLLDEIVVIRFGLIKNTMLHVL